LPGIAGGSAGFSMKSVIMPFSSTAMTPKAAGFLTRHLDAGDGAFGTALDVVDQHHGVIHLVDVVAGQNHDKLGFWIIGFEDVDVLVNGVGRATIPGLLVDPLLRRQAGRRTR
jgi:hypothetical protein